MLTDAQKAAKFTFKRGAKATGLAACASPHADVDIKLKGMKIGMIAPPSRFGHDDWRVRLIVDNVPSGDDPCEWKWAGLKKTFATEIEAREFVMRNCESIKDRFALHPLEPWG